MCCTRRTHLPFDLHLSLSPLCFALGEPLGANSPINAAKLTKRKNWNEKTRPTETNTNQNQTRGTEHVLYVKWTEKTYMAAYNSRYSFVWRSAFAVFVSLSTPFCCPIQWKNAFHTVIGIHFNDYFSVWAKPSRVRSICMCLSRLGFVHWNEDTDGREKWREWDRERKKKRERITENEEPFTQLWFNEPQRLSNRFSVRSTQTACEIHIQTNRIQMIRFRFEQSSGRNLIHCSSFFRRLLFQCTFENET